MHLGLIAFTNEVNGIDAVAPFQRLSDLLDPIAIAVQQYNLKNVISRLRFNVVHKHLIVRRGGVYEYQFQRIRLFALHGWRGRCGRGLLLEYPVLDLRCQRVAPDKGRCEVGGMQDARLHFLHHHRGIRFYHLSARISLRRFGETAECRVKPVQDLHHPGVLLFVCGRRFAVFGRRPFAIELQIGLAWPSGAPRCGRRRGHCASRFRRGEYFGMTTQA